MHSYVAFLRGINVGGNAVIKMDALKKSLAELGFQEIKTILASGNILFTTAETNEEKITKKIEEKLEKDFGRKISVMLRSIDNIHHFVTNNPFKNITVTPDTRLYVTFLSEKHTTTLPIPYESPEKNFKILTVSEKEVCSVLIVSPERNSTDAMKILEKEFGKNVTTRNWNTLLRIIK